jgi:hypothetical protein
VVCGAELDGGEALLAPTYHTFATADEFPERADALLLVRGHAVQHVDDVSAVRRRVLAPDELDEHQAVLPPLSY